MKRVYLEAIPHSMKKIDICEYQEGVFGVYNEGESEPHMTIADPEIDIKTLRDEFSEYCN